MNNERESAYSSRIIIIIYNNNNNKLISRAFNRDAIFRVTAGAYGRMGIIERQTCSEKANNDSSNTADFRWQSRVLVDVRINAVY